VQVKDATGCIVTNNALSITTAVVPQVTIAPDLCSNPATLTANVSGGGSNFSWTGPGIIGTNTAAKININSGGTYTVKATATTGGCSVSQTITINYNGPITPAFTQSDACQDQVVLTASPTGNYTYRWYENGAASPTQLGQQITVTKTDNGASFILEVFDAQSGCALRTTSKTVQVVGAITASLTSTLACDDGKAFTLTAATNASGPTYAWSLNGTSISSATAATLQQTSAGTYTVDVTSSGCKATASILITKAPIPHGALPKIATICNDPDNKNPATSKYDLDPRFFSAYNWFKNDIQLSPPYTSRVYTAESPGTYKVDLTNTYGCTNFNSTVVTNDCEPIVTAPNAFRPASSHTDNKTFRIFSFFITENFEVLVYNRWGEVVFESTDRNFHWNGGYKNNAGQPLPGETYVYLIRYVSSFHPDQGIKELRGGVVLLR
jgi:gliding motility-associated-like protein